MISQLQQALANRTGLLEQLHDENTDCYRLFHGTNEGCAGLTVDRYGPQLLVQTFHEPIDQTEAESIQQVTEQALAESLQLVYNDRSQKNSRRVDERQLDNLEYTGHELGVKYLVKGKHQGQDPLLFLDIRAGRRWMQQNAANKSVLNLFSYTCGVGVVAASAGANRVLNVDFSTRSLNVGRHNARLNGLSEDQISFFQSDFFTAAKQLAGIPIKQRVGRGRKPKSFPHIDEEQFDLVFLDPPRWAKSSFGTVDLIRDYPSVLKPSLLATKPGGQLVCANNVASVAFEDWLDVVKRCAAKAGRPVLDIQQIKPEADFPSPDGQFPLKMLVLQF
ncbi:class I SAM-dependent rRNA methyltransferase [Amphritea balenae]|uniref:Class I SAM-dependent rRNA methyltransferase n=1 Tax=Amphritea balenae TaxID=452629 RepID=A0A3P1SVB3_9GAMM|nr:class I SAM-dependent methyltransferase [Amphritea balenae]RRD01101.1 class I SAM-dependent rRNA methyltransferase [Amphritea balenae]GGK59952.1 SAM-dependent methyltransferase [Amphritea balenae]